MREARRAARVFLICGKVCSGKSTRARAIMRGEGAVALSCDEAMRALEDVLCEDYDTALGAMQAYLLKKAADLAKAGVSVVLDWGFWQRAQRRQADAYLKREGVCRVWHYIDVPDALWRARIAARNEAVRAGQAQEYFVDEGLLAKLHARFEAPERSEIDVWHDA